MPPPADREEVLSSEFTRPRSPALRPFSVGILKICRQLGLAIATPNAAPPAPEDSTREILAIAWLLDLTQSLEQVKAVVELPRADFDRELDDYAFRIAPAFLLSVKAELGRTEKALASTVFAVAPKPGGGPEHEPPKS